VILFYISILKRVDLFQARVKSHHIYQPLLRAFKRRFTMCTKSRWNLVSYPFFIYTMKILSTLFPNKRVQIINYSLIFPDTVIEFGRAVGLKTVSYDVIEAAGAESRMEQIRKGYGYEGEVLYFMDSKWDFFKYFDNENFQQFRWVSTHELPESIFQEKRPDQKIFQYHYNLFCHRHDLISLLSFNFILIISKIKILSNFYTLAGPVSRKFAYPTIL